MLEHHEPGSGQTAFKHHKRSGKAAGGPELCTSHFLAVDAPSALHGALIATDAGDQGDLCCPKCKARVGYFSWYGLQCACGAWVTPAIQVIKSKVDEAVGSARAVPVGAVRVPANAAAANHAVSQAARDLTMLRMRSPPAHASQR